MLPMLWLLRSATRIPRGHKPGLQFAGVELLPSAGRIHRIDIAYATAASKRVAADVQRTSLPRFPSVVVRRVHVDDRNMDADRRAELGHPLHDRLRLPPRRRR